MLVHRVARLRISWREILGLLVGLAICFGIISYALTNAPHNRETASEQTEKRTQQSTDKQPAPAPPATPPPPSSGGGAKTVTVRVTGFIGEPFSGQISTLYSSYSVTRVVPTDYELQVLTSSASTDTVFAKIQKTSGDNNVLTVQILDNGAVLRSQSTTEAYGVVSLTWSPNEQ